MIAQAVSSNKNIIPVPKFDPLDFTFADVFNANTIVTASGAFSNATSRQYFGRPWSSEAVTIYQRPSTRTDNLPFVYRLC